jgi:putative transcriptional regulator
VKQVHDLKAGVLLLAEPFMQDENFARAAILLCEYNQEGAFGLILNQTYPLSLSQLIDYDSPFNAPVRIGGPCERDTLHFVHINPDIPNAVPIIGDDFFWGGDYAFLRDAVAKNKLDPQDFLFFIGYAGWSEGQLDEEFKNGDWVAVACDAEWLMQSDVSAFWRNTLKALGGESAILANYPKHPKLN